jgi:uncharacterized protein with HEPN domain
VSDIEARILSLLQDISFSCRRIEDVLKSETQQSFTDMGNLNIQDIVARRLTVIGEAASILAKKFPEFCEKHKDIPVNEAKRLRNFIVHEYAGIDWVSIWNTTQISLPTLMRAVEFHLHEQDKSPSP